jgi:hypothetical protein
LPMPEVPPVIRTTLPSIPPFSETTIFLHESVLRDAYITLQGHVR